MKKLSSVLLILAVVCLWGCSGGSVPAEKSTTDGGDKAASGTENAVFEDNFETGEPSEWTAGDEADEAEAGADTASTDAAASEPETPPAH